jgi:uncharacterized protein (DUF885 family)
MKKLITMSIVSLVVISFFACGETEEKLSPLNQLADQYKNDYFRSQPVAATLYGFHEYDALMPNVTADSLSAFSRRMKKMKLVLDKIDRSTLTPNELVDYNVFGSNLSNHVFAIDSLREWQWNPMYYTDILGSSLYSLMSREFTTPRTRIISALNRLEKIPLFVGQAMGNIENASRIHTETAIQQLNGVIALIEGDLKTFSEEEGEFIAVIQNASEQAVLSLRAFEQFLTNEVLPNANNDFRLGASLYKKKLNMTLELPENSNTAQILTDAEAQLLKISDEMFTIARPVYEREKKTKIKNDEITPELKGKVIKFVLDFMAQEIPNPAMILDICEQYTDKTREFVRSKDLLTLPDDPIEIVEVPEFMRGVAVAYCDAPGPFDKGQKTFYMVAPLPEDWSDDQVKSFLREYNNYQLQDLTIHEAMPGHYVQLTFPKTYQSVIRDLFASGVFIEGWAVYAEQMMMEQGYGGNDNNLLKLAQKKMLLRVTINAIIDQKIHAGNMTKEEAITLMTGKGFQELSEAEGKWRRACLTSAQLSTYFVGYREMMDMLDRYKRMNKDNFELKAFHDRVLGTGAIPFVYLKQLVVKNIES